jgi:hypothetical protein
MDRFLPESNPSCGSKHVHVNESATSMLHCSVNFTGAWTPRMEWRGGGEDGALLRTCGGESVTPMDELLHLSCTTYVNVTQRNERTQRFQCRTYFTEDGLKNETYSSTDKYSRSVPSYNYTCSIHVDIGESRWFIALTFITTWYPVYTLYKDRIRINLCISSIFLGVY